MATIDASLDRLRRPEYTGENRCLPCTVVNAVIALVAATLVGLVWPPAGLVVLLVSAATIYLRGYLVPGTPELTKRYMPAWALRLFGKEPAGVETTRATATVPEGSNGDSTAETATPADGEIDLEAILEESGVVEECDDEDDLCLTDEFRDVWWRRIRRLRGSDDAASTRLGAMLDVDPEGLAFDEGDRRFTVRYEGNGIGAWDSKAAFYADLAVEPTLDEWLPEWGSLGDRGRTQLIAAMRAFLQRCPSCEADLEPVENVRETCCSARVVGVDVNCPGCDARVFSGRY